MGDKVIIAELNIDENPTRRANMVCAAFPTMPLFKNGEPVAQKVGAAAEVAARGLARGVALSPFDGGAAAGRLTSQAPRTYIARHLKTLVRGRVLLLPCAPLRDVPCCIVRQVASSARATTVMSPSSASSWRRSTRIEPTISALTDDELRTRQHLPPAAGERAKLDDLLPEAFATVREAAKRTLGQRHYDVQMIGGIALHRGEIAEMRTGEGKTLVATLATYLNALRARAPTSSPSTTISPAATPNGWDRSTTSWA